MSTPIAPIPLVETADKLTQLVERIGIIDQVKQKLTKQPDIASSKMAVVLEELMKVFLAFEAEVVSFLAITLEPGPDFKHDRGALYALEGNALGARMMAARGHCGKIDNIYTNYLDPWFQRITGLDKTEREALKELFDSLHSSDDYMVDLLNSASWWLSQRAEEVLDLYETNQQQEAISSIARARHELLPVRRALSRTVARLQALEADFISMSGTA